MNELVFLDFIIPSQNCVSNYRAVSEGISYLQVKIEFSQKEHKGVKFLLSLIISSDSCVPLFKLYSTSTGEFHLIPVHNLAKTMAVYKALQTDLKL